jgi:hypothetical protein
MTKEAIAPQCMAHLRAMAEATKDRHLKRLIEELEEDGKDEVL